MSSALYVDNTYIWEKTKLPKTEKPPNLSDQCVALDQFLKFSASCWVVISSSLSFLFFGVRRPALAPPVHTQCIRRVLDFTFQQLRFSLFQALLELSSMICFARIFDTLSMHLLTISWRSCKCNSLTSNLWMLLVLERVDGPFDSSGSSVVCIMLSGVVWVLYLSWQWIFCIQLQWLSPFYFIHSILLVLQGI